MHLSAEHIIYGVYTEFFQQKSDKLPKESQSLKKISTFGMNFTSEINKRILHNHSLVYF